jgi:hypothetical protein
MGTFFIILIVIIIALVASSKKNKKQERQSIPRIRADEKPISGEMKTAIFYYGEDWRNYLSTQNCQYELPNNFLETAALALRKLSIKEQYDLKKFFNSKVGPNVLYNLTFRLLQNRHCSTDKVYKVYRIAIDTLKTHSLTSSTPPIPPMKEEKLSHLAVEENKNVVMDNIIPPVQQLPEVEVLKINEETIDHRPTELEMPIQKEDNRSDPQEHHEIQSMLDQLIVGNNSEVINSNIIDIPDHHEKIISTQQFTSENTGTSFPSLNDLNIEELLARLDDSNLFPAEEEKVIIKPIEESTERRFEDNYNYDDYLLGKRYKDKMGLSKAQVALVNKLSGVNNVFTEVEGCCIETITLFLSCVKKLKATLTKKGSDLKIEIENLSDNARRIHKETRDGEWLFQDYYGQNHVNEYFEKQVYYTIFKRAENLIREKWHHKRKVSSDFIQYFKGLSPIFEERIGLDVNKILENLRTSIQDPDMVTEIELNRMNTTRWKSKFDTIKYELNSDNIEDFAKEIHSLFKENQKNSSAENIYYEACKVAYTIDKQEAIKLYLYYLNADLKSDKIDDKQLTKTIHKSLFKNDNHEQAFNDIIQQLKEDRDLASAIEKVDSIYAPIRRKIELNIDAIKTVQEQDKSTVELLNNYLQDEEEIVKDTLILKEMIMEKVSMETEHGTVESDLAHPFIEEIDLSLDQRELIGLFTTNSFELTQEQITDFCKARGLRSGPIINDVNEICYEILDDTLIEERDEEYMDMNEDYYKMIIKA